ncbi:MAG TPA: hypothetical protein VEB20_06675 [Azospirillaceae bacterium]|nr:hypothetical protein [Azospirillaceae bacterium]
MPGPGTPHQLIELADYVNGIVLDVLRGRGVEIDPADAATVEALLALSLAIRAGRTEAPADWAEIRARIGALYAAL